MPTDVGFNKESLHIRSCGSFGLRGSSMRYRLLIAGARPQQLFPKMSCIALRLSQTQTILGFSMEL